MSRIFVAGAAGFIGSHLALRLLERGDDVGLGPDTPYEKMAVDFVMWFRGYYKL